MAPKFAFQSILDYHHSRVELLEVDLSRLTQARQEGLDQLEGLNTNQNRLFNDLSELQMGEMDLQKIAQTRFNIKRIQNNIEKQQAMLQMLEQAINAKRNELIQARQDEAVFDKLKEKEQVRFDEKVNQQEKLLQDDIYISKAHRRPVSSSASE